MINLIPTYQLRAKLLRKAYMKLIAISYDEWFPYHDIREIEDSLDAGTHESILRIPDEDFYVYMGLLTQMEKLQNKLEKLYKQGSKP